MFYIRTWKCEMKMKMRFFSWKCSETLRGMIFECVVSRNSFYSKWHLIRCIKICLWVLFSIVNLHYSHCVELGRRQSDFIRSRLITFEGILFFIISCFNSYCGFYHSWISFIKTFIPFCAEITKYISLRLKI